MKAVLSMFLLIATPVAAGTDPAGGASFEHEEPPRYRVNVPGGWRVDRTSPNGVLLIAEDGTNVHIGIQARLASERLDFNDLSEKQLLEMADAIHQRFRSGIPGFKYESSGPTLLAGRKAAFLIFRQPHVVGGKGFEAVHHVIATSTGEHGVQLHLTARTRQYESKLPEFERIIDSFSFLDNRGDPRIIPLIAALAAAFLAAAFYWHRRRQTAA